MVQEPVNKFLKLIANARRDGSGPGYDEGRTAGCHLGSGLVKPTGTPEWQ
jgi:hypothetical protein